MIWGRAISWQQCTIFSLWKQDAQQYSGCNHHGFLVAVGHCSSVAMWTWVPLRTLHVRQRWVLRFSTRLVIFPQPQNKANTFISQIYSKLCTSSCFSYSDWYVFWMTQQNPESENPKEAQKENTPKTLVVSWPFRIRKWHVTKHLHLFQRSRNAGFCHGATHKALPQRFVAADWEVEWSQCDIHSCFLHLGSLVLWVDFEMGPRILGSRWLWWELQGVQLVHNSGFHSCNTNSNRCHRGNQDCRARLRSRRSQCTDWFQSHVLCLSTPRKLLWDNVLDRPCLCPCWYVGLWWTTSRFYLALYAMVLLCSIAHGGWWPPTCADECDRASDGINEQAKAVESTDAIIAAKTYSCHCWLVHGIIGVSIIVHHTAHSYLHICIFLGCSCDRSFRTLVVD